MSEEKKTEKVSKASFMKDLIEAFLPKDFNSTKRSLIKDVIAPTGKKFALDLVRTILYDSAPEQSSEPAHTIESRPASTVSIYHDQHKISSTSPDRKIWKAFEYDDITYLSEKDCMQALARLQEIARAEGNVSVAQLYETAGYSCEFSCGKYGWTNVDDATVDMRNGKYAIIFASRARYLG